MPTSVPNFLRKDDVLRKGKIGDANVRIEINSVLQVRQVGQLTAVEAVLCSRIEEVHVVQIKSPV